jgi:hypothetical protein
MAKGFQLKDGQNGQILDYPEHATAGSFEAGDPVDLNGGKVRIAASDQQIWGIAGADASGTTDTSIPVYVISPEQIWVAYADTTLNQTHVGNDYGLNISAGTSTVDIGDATTTSVVILGIDERDTAGTTARALVKFKGGIIQNHDNP